MTETAEPRTVRLVLDTSAVVGFVRGSIAVGELIAEIDLEHGAVIVPLPCLVHAAADTVDAGPWLTILTHHPGVFVVADDPQDWPMIAGVRKIVGWYEPATAAWAAITAGVDILTRHPQLYAGLGEDITLPFDD